MASDNVNEQRVEIKFYTLLGKSFFDIREDLHTVYGDSCISKSAICKWMNRFKEWRDTTKSDKRKGRPVLFRMKGKRLKFRNTFLKIEELLLKMLRNTLVFRMVQLRILCLGMRRVSARCVPHLLLPEQMGVKVKMCNEYCRQYNDEGDTFLNRVVTCDETWIYFFF